MEQGKNVVLLGGDHSCPLGYLEALAERHSSFSILHLDAHADLREAYEGFTYSHASILYNALQLPAVERLVQVGVRDLCPDEVQRIECSGGRIRLWDDYTLHRNLFEGTKWAQVCSRIVNDLGENVYVSFDIDALDPSLCPGTGTPVPGGLSFHQASYLLRCLHERRAEGDRGGPVRSKPRGGRRRLGCQRRSAYPLQTLQPAAGLLRALKEDLLHMKIPAGNSPRRDFKFPLAFY